jgi:TRAP transporter 4TM/12TM fusion protein
MDDHEEVNQVPRWRNRVAGVVGVLFSLFHFWNAYSGVFPGQQLTTVHLTGALMMGFLLKPAWERRWIHLDSALSILCAALAIATGVYLFLAYETYNLRAGMPTITDVVFGIVLIIVVLEGARRIVGNGLTLLAVLFLLYMYLGSHFPSGLSHRGFSIFEIAETMYLGTDGIHGLPLQVSAKYVVMFIIFGALLQNSGGGQFILDLATTVFGHVRGGPAKVSVLSSSLFGTISGSAVANVMVDGWLTIPLMRRMGCSPAFAAAVEAVASTGGQIMPPVMGAAAFLMAEFLGISYAKVALAAAIPALLYYLALYFILDFEAVRQGWTREAIKEAVNISRGNLRWVDSLHLFPLLVLVYFMFIQGNTPFISALWSCFAIMGIAQLFPKNRGLRKIITSLSEGGKGAIEVAIACGAVGIVLGALTQTGMGIQLSGILTSLSGGNLYLLLILTMISSLILGMGMPTTACYIIVTVTVVPALIKLGVIPIAAHMFVFYFGIISGITPPVALAAYAAAGIARSDPFKTGWMAVRLGASGFIIPFMFVTGPSLLLVGSVFTIARSLLTAIVGIVSLSAAIVGYGLVPIRFWERIGLGIAGILLIDPGWVTDVIGIVILVILSARQYTAWKSARRRPERETIGADGTI